MRGSDCHKVNKVQPCIDLFDLMDAVLVSGCIVSFESLSQSLVFRRAWSSTYAAVHDILLHLGMISEIKCKSLPAIAKAVGLENHQNLHHFLTESPWLVQQLHQKQLELTLKVLNGRSLILLYAFGGA
jgi:hypothetical protein